MLEKALKGTYRYYGLVAVLGGLVGVGFLFYLIQYFVGLKVTGMSRDVSWGFYIAQLTFLVGVAASAVMVVLPYYLHNYKAFGRITVIGEFLAVSAVLMCMLFVTVDMGKPERVLNVMLYPTVNSVLFWDMVVLTGYLILNIIIGWAALGAERKGVPAPKWTKPLIYLSIPWAVSIHTVTAFLYAGLPGRGYWLTAIMAPRFLSSAFSAGPALLILLALLLRRVTKFDAGKEAIQTLGTIVTYCIILNVFFFGLELFTVFYSSIPDHMVHFQYLFMGYHGKGAYIGWMWTSYALQVGAIVLLLRRKVRRNEKWLAIGCGMVFIGTWIDKGMGMISGGFVPSPLHHVTEYIPTFVELMISVGVYALGFLVLTILYKVATAVKEEVGG